MVLLDPLDICIIQFCVHTGKVLDYYPQAVDACMAPNLLSEVDVMWQVQNVMINSVFSID